MTEEFNIFKNLEELRKINLLDQLKSLESAQTEDLNNSLDNDDFDFDAIENNNFKKSFVNRQNHNKTTKTPEKKSKRSGKSRRSSTSSDRCISPTIDLLENVNNEIHEVPIARRTRRSLESTKIVEETDTTIENVERSRSKESGTGKEGGRGRGRVRGRGVVRGQVNKNKSLNCVNDDTIDLSVSSQCQPSHSSVKALTVPAASLDHSGSNLTIMESFLQRGKRGRSHVMRARRQYLAEIAARSTQVDYVDLVSSPNPRLVGFIELDSDIEDPMRITRSKKRNQKKFTNSCKYKVSSTNYKNSPLETSLDEDNPEINIKVNWKGRPESFKLRKYQKFSTIFNQLSERENINIECIVFNLNDRIIMADDTPDSINYKIFQFIDGRVLSNRLNSPRAVVGAVKKRDANNITLKIQSDKFKRALEINIMKADKFRILYIKCAEELKVGLDQLKLSFDGELLELNDTPANLDLEGGEAIDLHIKN